MSRKDREDMHTVKRNAILEVAQRLVVTRDYERMTIQDLLDEPLVSKGGVYYYFDSKPALLEALVERAQEQVQELLRPIAWDLDLPAREKFQRFFTEETLRDGLLRLERGYLVRTVAAYTDALERALGATAGS
jgi:AcrR family transcriptional regulator